MKESVENPRTTKNSIAGDVGNPSSQDKRDLMGSVSSEGSAENPKVSDNEEGNLKKQEDPNSSSTDESVPKLSGLVEGSVDSEQIPQVLSEQSNVNPQTSEKSKEDSVTTVSKRTYSPKVIRETINLQEGAGENFSCDRWYENRDSSESVGSLDCKNLFDSVWKDKLGQKPKSLILVTKEQLSSNLFGDSLQISSTIEESLSKSEGLKVNDMVCKNKGNLEDGRIIIACFSEENQQSLEPDLEVLRQLPI
ncbi:hypothetical protein [Mycoplasma suis]|uniref:Uncharacterized protein n=2 Tax=Mycoplasma suis TaxID=57372 RepID=F0QQ74_MYCSL|nr:hypothetical protein [Mycoplasma suis]ADX97644.1 hypothetical protein MSU_0100 [Mycoplasma suis str. Illinois]CBZ40180.1 hypothetical protein MSUIS_00870 [Mycoplasma suis KI3806]